MDKNCSFSCFINWFLYSALFPNINSSSPRSEQSLPLESHRHGEMERQMVLEERGKEKWQVLMSKDGRGWQRPVHSTPLFLSFLHPHFSSVTVNLKTWIWWWYLVTTAMLNSLLWYFLSGWYVRLYADQPGEASTLLSSRLCQICT